MKLRRVHAGSSLSGIGLLLPNGTSRRKTVATSPTTNTTDTVKKTTAMPPKKLFDFLQIDELGEQRSFPELLSQLLRPSFSKTAPCLFRRRSISLAMQPARLRLTLETVVPNQIRQQQGRQLQSTGWNAQL